MQPSPIQLSDEQIKEREAKAWALFDADYQEIRKKHNLEFRAILSAGPMGIVPELVVMRTNNENNNQNNPS